MSLTWSFKDCSDMLLGLPKCLGILKSLIYSLTHVATSVFTYQAAETDANCFARYCSCRLLDPLPGLPHRSNRRPPGGYSTAISYNET